MRKFSSNFPNKSLLYPGTCIRTVSKAKNKVIKNNNPTTWNIELLRKLFQRFCSHISILILFWVNILQRWFHFGGLNEQIGVDFTGYFKYHMLSTRFDRRFINFHHFFFIFMQIHYHFLNDIYFSLYTILDTNRRPNFNEWCVKIM